MPSCAIQDELHSHAVLRLRALTLVKCVAGSGELPLLSSLLSLEAHGNASEIHVRGCPCQADHFEFALMPNKKFILKLW
jgi:hypothetical protein